MEPLVPVAPRDLDGNLFRLIGEDWMLITAGTPGAWNTMTASWGGAGVLWNRNVVFCFVRPTRHTFGFLERSERFSLCFFGERWRPALNFCGSNSGRDTDKAAATGLTPVGPPEGPVRFAEARLVVIARKLYADDIRPERFVEPALDRLYTQRDYHRVYIGEIEEILRLPPPASP